MKLYLASFLQPDNFGPGRIISIAEDKPNFIKPEPMVFKHLVPDPHLTAWYNKNCIDDPKNAGKVFVSKFTAQLDKFYNDVMDACKKENKTPQDILPFENGDTLASWHRAEFTNYRRLIAPYLEKLGYDIVNN